MVRIFLFILVFSSFFTQPAAAFTLSNFDTPESFIVDPENGSYYVSNINGDPSVKDGNGYVSKISKDGSLVIQKFIGGKKEEPALNAPKGLGLLGKTLYVTDIDAVKGFDKETGKPSAVVDLSALGVKFLNDLAVDPARGVLYVSDTMTNQIFKIEVKKKNAVSMLARGEELGMPNGLLVNPKSKNLMVVTWGSGQILEIDAAGSVHVVKRGLSSLDGIDYDNQGNLYVSNFEKGEIYKIPKYGRGTLGTFLGGLTSPADISYDRKVDELLIPSFKGNTVITVSPSPKPDKPDHREDRQKDR